MEPPSASMRAVLVLRIPMPQRSPELRVICPPACPVAIVPSFMIETSPVVLGSFTPAVGLDASMS